MIRSKIASRFKRAQIMTCLWALLTLALHVWPGIVAPTHAQGSRKDDIVFNSRGIPLAGATVRVCAMPASGQPCTPLAQIYSDSALTQALANPTTTDGLGNYFFYAAPGKYEIEVSGPGITTKQLPNVILPNDPSSPTFSSLSSSGAMSAFSLNLTGNLTVNGSTTVIGNLASGTLNLTNQSTPPGAASSGTVNLYTKTADKRLYYKDDTGAEQGPLGSGAQTNATNTFTAAQNFDADIHSKGPNPWFDISRYGGYSASSPPSTTGSISSSSTSLTLANAQDFANGQGIVVYGAGAATTLTRPTQPTVTPTYVVNGSTTYAYQVVAEDRNGGLTAASPAGSTTSGAATLGANTVTLASCVRTNGVATYTTQGGVNHNLQAGTQVSTQGFPTGDNCNGVKTIASVPTGITFTTSEGPLTNETSNATGSVTAIACNTLTFAADSFSGYGTIHYWIYRSTNGGAYSLIGVAVGVDPWYQDCGLAAPTAPSYVPATPPSTPQPGYLATTIVSGGGSTSLTLANAAGTTITNQTVLHDNAKPLLAAMQAAINNAGGTVYIPNAGTAKWPFNATTDMTALSSNSYSVKVHDSSDQVFINQPWILAAGVDVEGEPHATASFQYVNTSAISGSANPLLMVPTSTNGVHIARMFLNVNGAQQVPLLEDGTVDAGSVGLILDDTSLNANAYGPALIIKGGFDFFINRGLCSTPGSGSFNGGSCIRLTDASAASGVNTSSGIAGRVRIDGMYFANTGMVADCMPNSSVNGGGIDGLSHILFESEIEPLLRINCPGGNSTFYVAEMNNVTTADIISGSGTPLVDAQNANNNMGVLICRVCIAGSGNPPLLIGPSGQANNPNLGLIEIGNSFANPGNLATSYTGTSLATTAQVQGNALLVPMANPLTAPGVSVSAGGSVPTGSVGYAVQFLDVNGNGTQVSPLGIATTSTGNQTVTITQPTPPAGATSWMVFREVNCPSCGTVLINTLPFVNPISTTSVVDTSSGAAGASPVSYPSAAQAGISANGVSGPALTLVNNNRSWATSFPVNLSVNRTVSIPDASGYAEISSYLNSAYDNFNRANGALGSNWTTNFTSCGGGCTSPAISGNQVTVLSGSGSGGGLYTARAFAADQFAQLTLTSAPTGNLALHLIVRGSGASGSGLSGYGCRLFNTSAFIYAWSNGSPTQLATTSLTFNQGDVVRCEAQGSTITFYQNGTPVLSTTDTTYTAPGNAGFYDGNPSDSTTTIDNFSAGNLHPFAHLDVEQDWTKTQHFVQGVAMGAETFTASPRAEQNVFLPSALTSTWTGATWTLDRAVAITRVQVQTKTAPTGCTTNAVVRLTDGTTPVNVTVSGAASDSGAIAQSYAAGASLTVSVQTAAAGCTTSPADANVVVQYRMQ